MNFLKFQNPVMEWDVYKWTVKPRTLEWLGVVSGAHQPAALKAAWLQWPDLARMTLPEYPNGRLLVRPKDDMRGLPAKVIGRKNPIAKHPITRVVVTRDAQGFHAKAYDDRGWLRSDINAPDRAYIERKAAEFWPDVPLEWVCDIPQVPS